MLMRKFSFIAALFFLFAISAHAGQNAKIIKVLGTHAAIDKGENSGLILGDTYQIIRSQMGREVVVGEARIKAIRSTFSAIEITKVKPSYKVMVGDELAPLYSEDVIIYNPPLTNDKHANNYGQNQNAALPLLGLKEFGGGASIMVVKETSVLSVDGLFGYYVRPNAKLGFHAVLQKSEGARTYAIGTGEYTHVFNTSLPTPVKPYVGAALGMADNGVDLKAAVGVHFGIHIMKPNSKWSNRFEIFLINADATFLGLRLGFSVFQ